MPKIFLVEGASGQYEDYRTWIVGARRTEAAAKALAKACKLQLNQKFARLKGVGCWRRDIKTELDPECLVAAFEGYVKESKKAKADREKNPFGPFGPAWTAPTPKQRWYHGVGYSVISTFLK